MKIISSQVVSTEKEDGDYIFNYVSLKLYGTEKDTFSNNEVKTKVY